MDKMLKAIFELLTVVILFILFSAIIQKNSYLFTNLLDKSLIGILIYLFVVIIAMVFAPISSVPLIPIISSIWGWKIAGFINLIAWLIGAIIIFLIVRKLGSKLITKLIPLSSLYKIEEKMSKTSILVNAFLLRMIIPADIMSYALVFFSDINFSTYLLLSFFAFIPAAFLLSYVGEIHFIYQLIVALVIFIIVLSIEVWGLYAKLSQNRNKIK
jgi:uncharacterized membrane protein YdjX (TVP38/TMEM64 family)